MKIENSRLDLLTHKRFPKEELFRLVKKDGEFVYDAKNNLPGRGYYLHKDKATLEEASRKRVLEKKGKVKEGFYLLLEEAL